MYHVGQLLLDLGWGPQRPRRRALERDEEVIERWVKEEWPRIKKRRQRGPIDLIWDRLSAHRGGPVAHPGAATGPRAFAARIRPRTQPGRIIWSHAKMDPLANFALAETEDLLRQTQRALLGIAAYQPLLRSLHPTRPAFFAPTIRHYLCVSQYPPG
jgi:hypothetical protein